MDFDHMTDEAPEALDYHNFSFLFFEVDLAIMTLVHLILNFS